MPTGLPAAWCIHLDPSSSARHCRRLLDYDLRPFLSSHRHDERRWCHRHGIIIMIVIMIINIFQTHSYQKKNCMRGAQLLFTQW